MFVEHTVLTTTAARQHPHDQRTFLVVRGTVELTHAEGSRRYEPGQGWHAPPGGVYRICAPLGPTTLIEAGSARGNTVESAFDVASPCAFPDLSDYTVDKPWGYEIWYTNNLVEPGYALKRIRMNAGHQSSLQSHRYKVETNYVIEGEATVLLGLRAPDEPTTTVDVARLTTTVHGPGSGWTSPANELHRVIARRDYTAIEVSTPELDDVIRWQDDTGRGHGRISTEHEAGRR
jgi:quercetin dioxygenase-like cupin family protein